MYVISIPCMKRTALIFITKKVYPSVPHSADIISIYPLEQDPNQAYLHLDITASATGECAHNIEVKKVNENKKFVDIVNF